MVHVQDRGLLLLPAQDEENRLDELDDSNEHHEVPPDEQLVVELLRRFDRAVQVAFERESELEEIIHESCANDDLKDVVSARHVI